MKNKILALWSTPRSRSTAFMWMMKQRGDFEVLQEPFGRSAYYSEERIFDRMADAAPNAIYNYQAVLRSLQQTSQRVPVFIKDFPYYFPHKITDEFLACFQHTFLIRDPAQMLPSYYYKMPDLKFEECGYKELCKLFERVVEFTGEIPVVVNADDLVERTPNIVQAYCSRSGIPFMPETLTWVPPGDSREIGWWGDRSWNDDLRVSHGFHQIRLSDYVSIHDNPTLRRFYELCLPYYEYMNQYRLSEEPSTRPQKYKIVYHRAMGRIIVATGHYIRGERICVGRCRGSAPERDTHSLQISEHEHVYLDEPAQLFSHSCEPNVYIKDNDYGGYDFHAAGRIRPGEILAFHYGMSEAESIAVKDCYCGAENCMGRSIGFKEAPLHVQTHLYRLGVAAYLHQWYEQGVVETPC